MNKTFVITLAAAATMFAGAAGANGWGNAGFGNAGIGAAAAFNNAAAAFGNITLAAGPQRHGVRRNGVRGNRGNRGLRNRGVRNRAHRAPRCQATILGEGQRYWVRNGKFLLAGNKEVCSARCAGRLNAVDNGNGDFTCTAPVRCQATILGQGQQYWVRGGKFLLAGNKEVCAVRCAGRLQAMDNGRGDFTCKRPERPNRRNRTNRRNAW